MTQKAAKPPLLSKTVLLKKVRADLKLLFRTLRDVRRAKGMSVEELSASAGVTEYMIRRIEESVRSAKMVNPDLRKVCRLAFVLGDGPAGAGDILAARIKLPRAQGKARR